MARRFKCPWHGKHEGTVCPRCARETRSDIRAGQRAGVDKRPHRCPQHPDSMVFGGVCTSPFHD